MYYTNYMYIYIYTYTYTPINKHILSNINHMIKILFYVYKATDTVICRLLYYMSYMYMCIHP